MNQNKRKFLIHRGMVKILNQKLQENIAYYLSLGMDVDGRDNAGFTALHEAVTKGHHNCVKLLLEQGANANEQSTDGTRYVFNKNF